MAKEKKIGLLPKLGIGIAAGILLGLFVPASVMAVINTIKAILGSVIFFIVPLVIFGFIAPAICGLKQNAGKMLGAFLGLSYISAVGASIFSAVAGYGFDSVFACTQLYECIGRHPENGLRFIYSASHAGYDSLGNGYPCRYFGIVDKSRNH